MDGVALFSRDVRRGCRVGNSCLRRVCWELSEGSGGFSETDGKRWGSRKCEMRPAGFVRDSGQAEVWSWVYRLRLGNVHPDRHLYEGGVCLHHPVRNRCPWVHWPGTLAVSLATYCGGWGKLWPSYSPSCVCAAPGSVDVCSPSRASLGSRKVSGRDLFAVFLFKEGDPAGL